MEDRREQLSALEDGELASFAARRLLSDMEDHLEWQEDWQLYHLIGESLRQGNPPVEAGVEGGMRAIEALREAKVAEPEVSSGSRRWTAWAVAASVALVALMVNRWGDVPSTGVAGGNTPAMASAPSQAELERYADMHESMANPGIQRISLVTPGDLKGR